MKFKPNHRSVQIFTLVLTAILLLISCQDESLSVVATDESKPSKVQVAASTQYQYPSLTGYASNHKRVLTSAEKTNLVKRWAPIHYQDVDAGGIGAEGGKSDWITSIDFDGDWETGNQWEHVSQYPLKAACYYSVHETSTHWFIMYAFYHPRDWVDTGSMPEEHENDLEGVLVVIEKSDNNNGYGVLRACITVAHSDFYEYIPTGSPYTEHHEGIQSTRLEMRTWAADGCAHPVTAQECEGHGLKAYPDYKINGDGIIYYPALDDVAEVPSDNYDNDVRYKLIDIFEPNGMWSRRNNKETFDNPNQFRNTLSVVQGHANTPWAWDDDDDSPLKGDLGRDPGLVVCDYFENRGTFSYLYTSNPYIDGRKNMMDVYYYIQNAASGKYIQVKSNSKSNGADVIESSYTGSGGQSFWMDYLDSNDGEGNPYCRFVNYTSQKVLDVYGGYTHNGAYIKQWTWGGGGNQTFAIKETEKCVYQFQGQASQKYMMILGTYYGIYDLQPESSWQKFRLTYDVDYK